MISKKSMASRTCEKPDIPILFRNYPVLASKIAWIPLGTFPTPIQSLPGLGIENLWIKRDDLSSVIYGGNKVRKLEFVLAEVKKKNSSHLITFGGIGTHHGLASAIFCNRLDIACTLLLYRQPVTRHVQLNLLLFKKYNAGLVYKKTLWKTVLSYYLFERLKHPGAYFLFAGGSSAVGTIGFVNAAFELKEQIRRGEMPEPSVIFCPLGSGGTLAGLCLGTRLSGLNSTVIGVRIMQSHLGPFEACTSNTVGKLIEKTHAYLSNHCRGLNDISMAAPRILDNYFGEGYGCPTNEGLRAYQLMKDRHDIILEPTYTAKTFAAVMDYCRSKAKNSGPVLYWHTYNSADLSPQTQSVDYRSLPRALQRFIEQTAIVT